MFQQRRHRWSQYIHSLGNVTAKAKTTAKAAVASQSITILLMYAAPGVNIRRITS